MRFWICYLVDYSFITVLRTWNKPVLILFNVDDLLRESEKHKRQMSHNQKVILGSMTEIGTLGENTEQSPGHIIINCGTHFSGLLALKVFDKNIFIL